MPPAHLEAVLERSRLDDVNNSARVLFLIQAFQHEVACRGTLVAHKVKVCAVRLDHERVGLLADFAFETLPEDGGIVVSLLDALLALEPLLKAVIVDEADRSRAFATRDQGVRRLRHRRPAESARVTLVVIDSGALLLAFRQVVIETLDFLELEEFFIVDDLNVRVLNLL